MYEPSPTEASVVSTPEESGCDALAICWNEASEADVPRPSSSSHSDRFASVAEPRNVSPSPRVAPRGSVRAAMGGVLSSTSERRLSDVLPAASSATRCSSAGPSDS